MVEVLKRKRWVSPIRRGNKYSTFPVTHLMGWLSEVLMRLLFANAWLLLGKVSSIAAEISCAMFPLCSIAHSCGHSAECIIGKDCFVASHHAWMSARVSW